MKKTILFIAILSIFSFSLSADVWMGITPREGAYGVNLASDSYRSDYKKNENEAENTGDDYYRKTSLSDVDPEFYTDDNIIAIGSLNDQDWESGGKSSVSMEVSFSCSNGEFCFVSESNPTYKRPFELIIFYTTHESGNEIHGYKKIITPSQRESLSTPGTGFWHPDDESFVHFNLVLVLPNDFDSNGNLNYGGRTYPLINADDYTAYVTITLTSEDADNSPQTITIPFSGYFNGLSNKDEGRRSDAINVTIDRKAAATNLDIQSLSNPDTGDTEVYVADVRMMCFWNQTQPSNSAVKMFFSASNDPLHSNDNGFQLVHSSVDYSSVRNGYNSIGYKIKAESYDTSDNIIYHQTNGDFDSSWDEINQNNPLSTSERIFYGRESVDNESDTTLNNAEVGGDFIYPEIHRAKSSQNDSWRYYSYWESPVYLIINKREVDNMFAGRYTSRVYFHVVAQDV